MAPNDHRYILVTGANRYDKRAYGTIVVLPQHLSTDSFFQWFGFGYLHSPD